MHWVYIDLCYIMEVIKEGEIMEALFSYVLVLAISIIVGLIFTVIGVFSDTSFCWMVYSLR